MIHIKHAITALSFIAVVSTASLAIPEYIPSASNSNSIVVGAQENAGTGDTRLAAIPIRLAVVVFNKKAQLDTVGKDQPPLTENELLAALNWINVRRDMSKMTAKEYVTLQKIIESRSLVDGAYLESVNIYRYINLYDGYVAGGSDVQHFAVWSLRLVVPHAGGATAFTVRERFVHSRQRELEFPMQQHNEGQMPPAATSVVPMDIDISENSTNTGLMSPDFNGDSIKVGEIGDERKMPVPSKLPAVVNEFNEKAKLDSVGKKQPALTEEELLTALKWSMTGRDMTKPVTKEYDTLQKIITSRKLTDGAYLKSVNGCEYRVTLLSTEGGTEHRVYSMWTIFLVVPHADGTHAFPIRRQFVSYRMNRVSGYTQREQLAQPASLVTKTRKLADVLRKFNEKTQQDPLAKLNLH